MHWSFWRVLFWSCVSRQGTNFAATRLMFKSTVKICWQELQLTPVDLVNCVPIILVDFFDILVSTTCWWAPRMRMIFNAHFSSFEPRKPLENLRTAQCFLLKGPLKHFMCFYGRFSEMETKSQADSLFGMVRHHDFTRGACQHFGQLTTEAHTTFYGDVRLATDSWRVHLHSPSGGTLNYN